MKEFLLNIASVDLGSVSRCLGYGPNSEMHPEVIDRVRQCSREVLDLDGIECAFVSVPIAGVDEEGISLERGNIVSPKLARIAVDAESLAFGLVTMGRRYDEWIEASDGLLEACVKEAVGTVLVENGVDRLLQEIGAETGLETSLPFSPGYCDLELKGQELVFSVFPPNPLGISLFENSLMMSPQKSVSFVTCLGVRIHQGNPCRSCTLKKCFMRRQE